MRGYGLSPFRCFVTCLAFWFLVSYVGAQSVTEESLFRATGNLYAEDEADILMRQGKLASTPSTAGVPLTFNLEGRLLTAKEFNALVDTLSDENSWDAERYRSFWTDFTTYQTILRKAQKLGLQSQARVNLVKDYRYIVPPPSAEFSGPYLFDPFQKFYQTWEEMERAMERKTRQQAP